MNVDSLYCDALNALGELAQEYGVVRRPNEGWTLGRYESDKTALALVEIAAAQAVAVQALGEARPGLLPGATVCARAGFESGAVAAWLAFPDDPFEREGRWLGYEQAGLRSSCKLLERLAERDAHAADSSRQRVSAAQQWVDEIERRLPRGRKVAKPNFAEILRQIGKPEMYIAYCTSSEVAHGGPDAMHLVHKTWPENAEVTAADGDERDTWHIYGQIATRGDWAAPIRMSAWGIMISAPIVLQRIGTDFATVSRLSEKQDAVLRAADRLEPTREGDDLA